MFKVYSVIFQTCVIICKITYCILNNIELYRCTISSSVDQNELQEAIGKEKQVKAELDDLEAKLQKISEDNRKNEKNIEKIKNEHNKLRECIFHIENFEKKIKTKLLLLEKIESQKLDIVGIRETQLVN